VKNLTTVALVLALFCAPSLARAEMSGIPPATVSDSSDGRPIAPRGGTTLPDEARDYAAREAASPALGAFEGGGVGIYIGGSTVVVVLVVLLIVIIL
jgi:hypothetical protein